MVKISPNINKIFYIPPPPPSPLNDTYSKFMLMKKIMKSILYSLKHSLRISMMFYYVLAVHKLGYDALVVQELGYIYICISIVQELRYVHVPTVF